MTIILNMFGKVGFHSKKIPTGMFRGMYAYVCVFVD